MLAPQPINNLMPVALLCTRQCSRLLTYRNSFNFLKSGTSYFLFPQFTDGETEIQTGSVKFA